MDLFGRFQKLLGKKEKKSGSFGTERIVIGDNGKIVFMRATNNKITPKQAYDIYGKVSVVYDAVDKISSRVASLNLVMKGKDREIIKEHEFLKLLQNPDTSISKTAFWDRIATSYSLTHEAYIVARGNVKNPPLALETIEPYYVEGITLKANMPDKLIVNAPNERREYYLKNIDGRERYISNDELNELIPIIGKRYANDWRGMSKLSVLLDESVHIEAGNKHNRSLLENNLTSSKIFSPDTGDSIDEEDGDELRNVIENYYTGYNNAGKPLILPYPLRLLSQGGNIKDMDYANLIAVDETRIYRAYNIPLPLVKDSTMTQANFEVAIPFLYYDAIIPVFSFIADELTIKLLPRYKNSEGLKLSYDEFAIPSLQIAHSKMMSDLKNTECLTRNEIRARGGYEDVEGGDEILVSAGLVSLTDRKTEGYGEVE